MDIFKKKTKIPETEAQKNARISTENLCKMSQEDFDAHVSELKTKVQQLSDSAKVNPAHMWELREVLTALQECTMNKNRSSAFRFVRVQNSIRRETRAGMRKKRRMVLVQKSRFTKKTITLSRSERYKVETKLAELRIMDSKVHKPSLVKDFMKDNRLSYISSDTEASRKLAKNKKRK